MPVSFNLDSRFNKDANFKKVLFGFDGKLLEVELNELQDIFIHRLANFVSIVYKDRPLYNGSYTVTSGKLSIADEYVVIDRDILHIPSATLNVSIGDTIYLNKKELEIGMYDAVRKHGNLQSSATIPNHLYDERMGEETTKRIQTVYDLSKTNSGSGSYVKLCSIVAGSGGSPTIAKANYDDSILFTEIKRLIAESSSAHSDLKNNPHNVTKAQIGLGNVENVKQATAGEFKAHTDNSGIHLTPTEKSNLHGHHNKSILDELQDNNGQLNYKGTSIGNPNAVDKRGDSVVGAINFNNSSTARIVIPVGTDKWAT